MQDVIVLCYHAVSETWCADLSVTPQRLEEQVKVLLERGYRASTFAQAVNAPPAERTFALTFDDAFLSVFELAFPILSRLGVPATVFVPTGLIGSDEPMVWQHMEHWLDGPDERELLGMTWEQVEELDRAGWEIGSHSQTHPHLTRLAEDALATELHESREDCRRRLGKPCLSLAYPYGDYDDRVVRATAAAGYSAAGTLPKRLHRNDSLAWPRIGIYHHDDLSRFRQKVSPGLRRMRSSRAWPLLSWVDRRMTRNGFQPDDDSASSGMARTSSDNSKLRVVTLTHSLIPYGGAERIARLITAGLDRSRFERTICVTRPPRNSHADAFDVTRDDLEDAGVRVIVLNRPFRFAFWSWWPLIRFLRRERVDILHAHQFGSNAWGTLIGRLAGVPVVIAHEHSGSFDQEALRRFVHREVIARGSDAFLAVSRNSRQRMIEVEGIDPDDVVFVPLGIPDPPASAGRDVREELGIQPGAQVIGTVGVMRPEKALDVLMRSASLLSSEFPQLRVVIVGDGPERPRLERLVAELGLSEIVALAGYRRDVPDVLAAFDVAVCCSDFEGSPLSVMEYMEAGKPVVATRVGGVPDIIDDGVHGLLVEPQDPEALASAIRTLLRDPEGAAEMSRLAQERRRSEFHVDSLIRRMESLYEELYATKSRTPALRTSA